MVRNCFSSAFKSLCSLFKAAKQSKSSRLSSAVLIRTREQVDARNRLLAARKRREGSRSFLTASLISLLIDPTRRIPYKKVKRRPKRPRSSFKHARWEDDRVPLNVWA